MKKLTIIVLSLICIFALNIYANGQDTESSGASVPTDSPTEGQKDVTLIDFSVVPDPGEIDGITPEDMSPANYRVWQNASATDYLTMRESYCRDVEGKLGVKVHFPHDSLASHAYIEPKYPINVFNKEGSVINTGKGIIRNVGVLKEIKVNVAGRGYKVGLGVRLKNERGEVKEFFMGYLNFVGWKELSWKNIKYNPRVDPKRLGSIKAVYPLHEPYLTFDSFVIHRYAGGHGADFVVYFKDVKVTYDVAVPKSQYDNITENDDGIWKVHQALYKARNGDVAGKTEYMKTLEKQAIDRKGESVNYVKDGEYPKEEEASSSDPSTSEG